MRIGMDWWIDRRRRLVRITFWDGFVMYMPYQGLWDCEAFRNYNSVVLLDQYRVEDFVSPGDVVIDAGAHVGLFSYKAAELGAHVHAFEPYMPNAQAFGAFMHEHALEAVRLTPVALSDSNGTARFREAPHISGGGCITKEGSLTIPIRRLDDYVDSQKLRHVDFIKIDTEGHERRVLRGAAQTIAKFRPVIAASAYHFPEDEKELPELVNSLAGGYHIVVERARGYLPCEKVMFAVPEERLESHNPWA